MSESLGVQDARRRLPELLRRAEAGEQLVINRNGQPMAALGLEGTGRGYWSQASRNRPSNRDHQGDPGPPLDLHHLPYGALIGFDASALIDFLRGTAGSGGFTSRLLGGIARGYWRGQISSLSLMRLLEGPLSHGHETRAQSYRQVFADVQAWQVVAVDAAVAEAAARLRQRPAAVGGLSSAAALELAAAISAGAAVLVSNDAEVLACHRVLDAIDLPVVPGSGHLRQGRSSC